MAVVGTTKKHYMVFNIRYLYLCNKDLAVVGTTNKHYIVFNIRYL